MKKISIDPVFNFFRNCVIWLGLQKAKVKYAVPKHKIMEDFLTYSIRLGRKRQDKVLKMGKKIKRDYCHS